MSFYLFGPFQLDADRLLLLDRGVPIALGPKVVETLLALVERPGEVFAKRALLERIWPEGYVDEANLAQNVYVLRKTLRARWDAEAIETIPRRGYRFIAPVARSEAAPLRPATARRPAPAPMVYRWSAMAASVALALIGALSLTIALSHGVSARATRSAEGTRLYEIGRYYWNLRTRDGIGKSMQYFARVIDADPRDARGYAALASANAMMADYGYGIASPRVYGDRARAYAHKALTLDPNCGEAYAVLGVLKEQKKMGAPNQLDPALRDLRRAVALDPTSGPAHEWYGVALLNTGNVPAAYRELSTAAQLDPLSVATTAWLGSAAYLAGRYTDALAYARETLDLSPQRSDAYEILGLSYEALGDRSAAMKAFEQLGRTCPKCRPQAAVLLAPLNAGAHRIAAAHAEVALAIAHPQEVAPEDVAVAFASMGRTAAALTWLRRSNTAFAATEIANDPRFHSLRRAAGIGLQKPA
ncbi:MAG: winged helix-turn-helix domain-containing protein [Candidatus Eremiobacteraeota bacterium]|nr:winged helix-turn-helix domain-containing protein [Candidatus Eremiobacteraeota bacterium]MBV9055623.1 winged helix-turn-helix domain-containing protein [Candidatus Eremiobacteraeota bacterium]MBV9698932.1 winged helix-turn-helix domain-containing protein [Candidatus Eremiobacteraeota bacterium]